eukprot:6595239-Prorocentrum_lima.AAC.1
MSAHGNHTKLLSSGLKALWFLSQQSEEIKNRLVTLDAPKSAMRAVKALFDLVFPSRANQPGPAALFLCTE